MKKIKGSDASNIPTSKRLWIKPEKTHKAYQELSRWVCPGEFSEKMRLYTSITHYGMANVSMYDRAGLYNRI